MVHELCEHEDIDVIHIETDKQKGDFLTRGTQRPKHELAMNTLGIYPVL